MATNLDVKLGQPVTSIWVSSEGEAMHCGVTGGWVQNLKASYLLNKLIYLQEILIRRLFLLFQEEAMKMACLLFIVNKCI